MKTLLNCVTFKLYPQNLRVSLYAAVNWGYKSQEKAANVSPISKYIWNSDEKYGPFHEILVLMSYEYINSIYIFGSNLHGPKSHVKWGRVFIYVPAL